MTRGQTLQQFALHSGTSISTLEALASALAQRHMLPRASAGGGRNAQDMDNIDLTYLTLGWATGEVKNAAGATVELGQTPFVEGSTYLSQNTPGTFLIGLDQVEPVVATLVHACLQEMRAKDNVRLALNWLINWLSTADGIAARNAMADRGGFDFVVRRSILSGWSIDFNFWFYPVPSERPRFEAKLMTFSHRSKVKLDQSDFERARRFKAAVSEARVFNDDFFGLLADCWSHTQAARRLRDNRLSRVRPAPTKSWSGLEEEEGSTLAGVEPSKSDQLEDDKQPTIYPNALPTARRDGRSLGGKKARGAELLPPSKPAQRPDDPSHK